MTNSQLKTQLIQMMISGLSIMIILLALKLADIIGVISLEKIALDAPVLLPIFATILAPHARNVSKRIILTNNKSDHGEKS